MPSGPDLARRRFLAAALAIPAATVLAANAGLHANPGLPDPANQSRFRLTGAATQGGWLRGTAPVGTVALSLDGASLPLAPDLGFLIAFDRDAGLEHSLRAMLADGSAHEETVTLAPRAWRIERVDAPLRPGKEPEEEFRRLREAELDRIRAARAVKTPAQGWRQAFAWPARGRISGRFGSQRIYQGQPGAYHSGLDIAAPTGTPFVAPADGVVILAAQSPFTLEGRLLMIDHGAGLNSAFLHCSALLVEGGAPVRRGQPIGQIGATGRASGPHLHWSMKWRESRLDPLLFLGTASGIA